MLYLRIIIIVGWLTVGVRVLSKEKISKFDYGIVWIMLIFYNIVALLLLT